MTLCKVSASKTDTLQITFFRCFLIQSTMFMLLKYWRIPTRYLSLSSNTGNFLRNA